MIHRPLNVDVSCFGDTSEQARAAIEEASEDIDLL
jgi:hypothetical protein